MKLSTNFTLEELCVTDTGLPNIPDDNAMRSLLYLATYILQPGQWLLLKQIERINLLYKGIRNVSMDERRCVK